MAFDVAEVTHPPPCPPPPVGFDVVEVTANKFFFMLKRLPHSGFNVVQVAAY